MRSLRTFAVPFAVSVVNGPWRDGSAVGRESRKTNVNLWGGGSDRIEARCFFIFALRDAKVGRIYLTKKKKKVGRIDVCGERGGGEYYVAAKLA